MFYRSSDYPHFTDKETETGQLTDFPKVTHLGNDKARSQLIPLEMSGGASSGVAEGCGRSPTASPGHTPTGWDLPLVMPCRRRQRKSGIQFCPTSRSRKQHFLGKLSRGAKRNKKPSEHSFLELAGARESHVRD